MGGLVSDSDSVDTDGYFTSFRSDCGFPKSKKSSPGEDGDEEGGNEGENQGKDDGGTSTTDDKQQNSSLESEYDLFGKGSTSTTASSCGTVVLRNKPNHPTRTSSTGVGVSVGTMESEQKSTHLQSKSLQVVSFRYFD